MFARKRLPGSCCDRGKPSLTVRAYFAKILPPFWELVCIGTISHNDASNSIAGPGSSSEHTMQAATAASSSINWINAKPFLVNRSLPWTSPELVCTFYFWANCNCVIVGSHDSHPRHVRKLLSVFLLQFSIVLALQVTFRKFKFTSVQSNTRCLAFLQCLVLRSRAVGLLPIIINVGQLPLFSCVRCQTWHCQLNMRKLRSNFRN